MARAKWSLPIDKYVEAAKGDLNKACRKVGFAMLAKVMVRSPVDTGRFRGNWMIGVEVMPATAITPDGIGPGRQPGDPPLAGAPSGAAVDGAVINNALSALGQFKLGQTIWIINNVPYAVALEQGHSKQAPAGVVKITVQEFGAITSREARAIRAGQSS
jgi:hypothetical protein